MNKEGTNSNDRLGELEQYYAGLIRTYTRGLSIAERKDMVAFCMEAAQMARRLKLKPRVLSAHHPVHTERSLMLVAISKDWGETASDTVRVNLEQQCRQLYAYPRERGIEIVRRSPKVQGLPADVCFELLRRLYPDIADFPQGLRNLSHEKKVVEIPRDHEIGNFVLRQVMTDYGYPYDESDRLMGFADLEMGRGFVWSDAPPVIRAHEAEHVNNSQLLLGELGVGLNEAVTQWRALECIVGDPEKILAMRNVGSIAYLRQMQLLRELYSRVPGLSLIMNARYQEARMDESVALASKLIGHFGLQGWRELYTVRAHHDGEDDGLISPEEWARKYL